MVASKNGNLILKISEHNWGLRNEFDWNCKTWYIYDDLTINYIIEFVSPNKKNFFINYKVDNKFLSQILNNIERAKKDSFDVSACDGEAWKFVQYKNNKIVWKRDLGYIYGIIHLENISKDLLNSVSKIRRYN